MERCFLERMRMGLDNDIWKKQRAQGLAPGGIQSLAVHTNRAYFGEYCGESQGWGRTESDTTEVT